MNPPYWHYSSLTHLYLLHLSPQELLESYLIDFNALESKIEYVRSQIQNAEELVSALLLSFLFFAN